MDINSSVVNESPLLTVHILKIYTYLNYQVDRKLCMIKFVLQISWDKTIIQKLTLKNLNVHWKIFQVALFLSFSTHFRKIHSRKIKKFIRDIKTWNTKISYKYFRYSLVIKAPLNVFYNHRSI